MFAGNFPPAGWWFCDGSLWPISEYETLFQLIGTTYGGDGEITFALPDLRGRLPLHMGSGFIQGETGGVEEITLAVQQIPVHSHSLTASAKFAQQSAPADNVPGRSAGFDAYTRQSPNQPLSPNTFISAGGSQPHDNFQPYLCVNFIISLFGIFPQHS